MSAFDFEGLKKKVTDIAESVVGKSSEAAKTVADKAQGLAKKAKLNTEVAAEREALKRKYQELGKLYYEKYSGNTDPDFADVAADIELSVSKIAAWQEELAAMDAEEPATEVEGEPADEPKEDEPKEETPAEEAKPEEAKPEEETPAEEPEHVLDEKEDTVEHEAAESALEAEAVAEEAAKEFEAAVNPVIDIDTEKKPEE